MTFNMPWAQICLPPLGPSLCTGHLPVDDGPDPHPLQWRDWNCRWCSCSWKGWQWTWQMSPQIHQSLPWTWACFQQGKCAVKQTSVVFFRCISDATGAHPDPEKVSAVHNMSSPETATQLQVFLTLVTYLSPSIPPLSSFTNPLCWLLKKRTEFIRNNSYQEAFDKVKSMVCKDTVVLWHPWACHSKSTHPKLRCCPPSRWPPSCLCFQGTYTCGAALCQHRMWTAHLCLWSSKIPHLCLWPCLHCWEWP